MSRPVARVRGGRTLACSVVAALGAVAGTGVAQDDPDARAWEIAPVALLMLDFSNADGVYAEGEGGGTRSDATVRRARLGVELEVGERWEAELSVDVEPDGGDVELHEASIGVEVTELHELTAGFVKQPFGIENLTSSRRLRTLERSIATNAFAPDRAAGLVYTLDGDALRGSVGAFVDTDESDVREAAARVTWAPVDEKRSIVHVGASVAYRDDAGVRYRIEDEAGLAAGDEVFRSGRYDPDAVATAGLEAAWMAGGTWMQAELFGQRVSLGEADDEVDDPTFTGGYVHVGRVMGGGRRRYSNGRFGDLAGGDLDQPVELVAGAGLVDTIHEGGGDRAEEYLVGVNAVFEDRVRLGGQVRHLVVEQADGETDRGEAVLLRLQLEW